LDSLEVVAGWWKGREVMMRRILIMMALVSALVAGGCAADVTESDEYQDLETEETTTEVPAEVAAMVDDWWAANDRRDGSVVDLYLPSGYHLYGDQRIMRDDLAGHFGAEGWTSERISGPYLVAAEPAGRYVVTIGVRNTNAGSSFASALTFEIVTRNGEHEIAQTAWTEVHR
jgi:hypothetical protein